MVSIRSVEGATDAYDRQAEVLRFFASRPCGSKCSGTCSDAGGWETFRNPASKTIAKALAEEGLLARTRGAKGDAFHINDAGRGALAELDRKRPKPAKLPRLTLRLLRGIEASLNAHAAGSAEDMLGVNTDEANDLHEAAMDAIPWVQQEIARRRSRRFKVGGPSR